MSTLPRTNTGCLTCRQRKVKCDEGKPVCGRCIKIFRQCNWEQPSAPTSDYTFKLLYQARRNFGTGSFNIDAMVPYIHYFTTFCCRFLAYPNVWGNPFERYLVPLAATSPALLYSMAAVAASHWDRYQEKHTSTAVNYYSTAVSELRDSLADTTITELDSTLGACLLLCVYEILDPESFSWAIHLHGAKALILHRGKPSSTHYLTHFFSFLDISNSLTTNGSPLLEGYYWLGDEVDESGNSLAYDPCGVTMDHFHSLMIFMAKLSRLSSDSMAEDADFQLIKTKAFQISSDLREWWGNRPPGLRDQRNDWRRQLWPRKLTEIETLQQEAFSSTKSCMYGCVIYLHHILDPSGREGQNSEVTNAISQILEIAQEIPRGYGLEMSHYWSLFMVGISVFNDNAKEEFLRQKLMSDPRVSIYHANRPLKLLEFLWGWQHHYQCKYDWRVVQIQTGIQPFILI